MLVDRNRKAMGWRARAATLALLAAPALALSALAWADDAAEQAPKRPTQQQMSEAREIYGAFREMYDALQKEGQDRDKASGAQIPDRPAKTHTSPTIDSAQIDAMLEKGLADSKVTPARLTTDEEFVRRVYLDVTGKLPSPDQFASFVHSKDKHKREKLIDQLLETPACASNLARYWVDVVRFHAANTNVGQVRYPVLEQWLTERFAKNAPWDEIASELITATGRNDENGATVFALAQMAQPVEMAGEVSRVFMGVQIQCAQCHDHPNDPWKREQFHQFAAFFAGTRARRATAPQMNANGQVVRLPAFEVVAQGRARYTMPDKADPQKQIPVAPKFFLASNKEPLPDSLTAVERRKLVASYVTGQDNPWFAKAFVNRVWYSLMGEGFYNPVDDMGPTRTPNAPEVLDELASQWQQGGYDVRWLLRTVLGTKAYQRESRATNTASGRTPFASNCPSRLRADQIMDSLVQALDLKMMGPGGGPGGPLGKAAAKKAAGFGPQGQANNPRFLFGVDPSTPNDDVLGTIPQALFLMNDPRVNRAMSANNGTVLGEILSATPDNRVALEALYLRVLARRPSSKEVSTCGRYLETIGDRREGFEDILWSLVNSTEFLSRR